MLVKNLRHSTVFRLKPTSPYNFLLTIRKPAGWDLLTHFEIFKNGTLWTAMRMPSGELFGLKLGSLGTTHKPKISCEIYSRKKLDKKKRKKVLMTLRWVLSVDEDIHGFYDLARHDHLVKALVEDLYGMRITRRLDIFPRFILAVTLQMAPIKRSSQMMDLLIKNYGVKVRLDGKEVLYWPSPERMARAKARGLRVKCKLGYRAEILRGIARAVCKGFPTLRELERMPSEEAKDKLMKLKGIGEYSADIISLHQGFPLDIWSAKIFNFLLFRKKKASRKIIPDLKRVAEDRWGDWRGYVFFYVLNDLVNLSRRYRFDLTKL